MAASAPGTALCDHGWKQRVGLETRALVAAAENRRYKKTNVFGLPDLGPPLPTSHTIRAHEHAGSEPLTTSESRTSRRSSLGTNTGSGARYAVASDDAGVLERHHASGDGGSTPLLPPAAASSQRRSSQHSSSKKLSSAKPSQGSKGSGSRKESASAFSDGTSYVTSANSSVESRLLGLELQLKEEKRGRRAVEDELLQIKALMRAMRMPVS